MGAGSRHWPPLPRGTSAQPLETSSCTCKSCAQRKGTLQLCRCCCLQCCCPDCRKAPAVGTLPAQPPPAGCPSWVASLGILWASGTLLQHRHGRGAAPRCRPWRWVVRRSLTILKCAQTIFDWLRSAQTGGFDGNLKGTSLLSRCGACWARAALSSREVHKRRRTKREERETLRKVLQPAGRFMTRQVSRVSPAAAAHLPPVHCVRKGEPAEWEVRRLLLYGAAAHSPRAAYRALLPAGNPGPFVDTMAPRPTAAVTRLTGP